MSWTLLHRLVFVVCFSCAMANDAFCQDSDSEEKDKAAEKAGNETDDGIAQMTFEELKTYHSTKMRAYSKRYRAAPTRDEKLKVFKTIPSVLTYRPRLIELVNEQPGSEAGLEVIDWWYRAGGRRLDAAAITRLVLKNYSELESVRKYVPQISWHLSDEEAEERLKALFEINSFDSVKASATYQLHELLRTRAKELKGEAASAVNAEVKALRGLIYEQYPEETILKGAKYVELIDAVDFAARLEIGNPVPDIVGTDLDGVEFKLSDYDGKVRVISFWGDW